MFVLDSCWGGQMKPFVCMNKQTGERCLIGNCPKVLNHFNDTMFAVDCWDLIQAPKRRKYSIEMYGCKGTRT
eukprot:2144242-Ditylum_brightwellii.AAC.1